MRESEAWRILAEEHDAWRTNSPFLCVNLNHCTDRAFRNRALATIPGVLRWIMVARIDAAVGSSIFSAYSDTDTTADEGRQARVLACLMFSEQAKDEERAK